MSVIDESKLNDILPKYDELKLSGKNLAQQYVSAFNTGMNIYQCINQLQGYIEWAIKSVNDVVVQWNETVDSQIKCAINESVDASKQATTEQFNIEWEKAQHTLETLENKVQQALETLENNVQHELETLENKVQHELETFETNVSLIKYGTGGYYVLTESKDKNVKKLDFYVKYNFEYLPSAPYYNNNMLVRDLDLEGYTVKSSVLSSNTCKLKDKSKGNLIDYVYLMLDDNLTVKTTKNDPQVVFTEIAMKFLPYFAKLKTATPVTGQCYVETCVSIILEKTSS